MSAVVLDDVDRVILNRLQRGFPLCERPYQAVADELAIGEDELLARLRSLLESGTLTRFGPLYQIERAGGAFVLAAMEIPPEDVERVAALVNALPEVAHNYLRTHRLNMWFVVAVEAKDDVEAVMAHIERDTGYPVYAMPKLREYFVGLYLPV
ncbi:MAG TPA: Lrp/AsnC family transcriptional regulator [Burkholderiales bacterium]|nr:Lrp/AsnC family transcriptional regulator [Burkholderiales bacterium]